VHDTFHFETRGVPSVFVASEEFARAADVQARALGMPDVRHVYVAHPIQDASDDEMRAKAEKAYNEIVVALLN